MQYGHKIPFISNKVNKVKKGNEIWSQNSIYFEGVKKKKIEFGRKILFIQPESEKKDGIWSQNSI